MQSIDTTLQKYWGYKGFRPLQREVIEAVLARKDVLALMPTGGGKSLCFQVPTMVQEGLCLVVSPLIALMQDQVHQLKQRGIAAVCIVSGMGPKEVDVALDHCVYGRVKFLYVSPERLQSEFFLVRVQKMNICLLVVDEAHCISSWGNDFRPAYKQIARIKPLLPGVSTLALTATATLQVAKDIQEQLVLQHTKVFQTSFIRKNLAYVVRKIPHVQAQLIHLLQSVAGSAIVYVSTRRKAKMIADVLEKKGIRATYYHAGVEAKVRMQRQKAWIASAVRVMVATNAFGMGIDKPDVRMVVHIDLPDSLEAYYQEAGRAGRDGHKAYAVVLYNSDSIQNLQEAIHNAYPAVEKIKQVYQCLANYYQVAVGSHQMVCYDFDIQDFAFTYQLSATMASQAIARLQDEGLIQYNNQYFKPAKIYITALPKVLYAFQVAHKHHDKLIQALVHIYGEKLFHDFCTISIKRLAKYVQYSTKTLDQQLTMLHTLNILHYTPQKNHAQITFVTPRYAKEHLPLSKHRLDQRKKTAWAKAKAVLLYMKHKYRCRTLILVEYFGQVSYKSCGVCDICLDQKKTYSPNAKELKRYQELILEHINKGPHTMYMIIQAIDADQAVLLSKLIRVMIDKGELVYDNTLRLARP